MTLRHVCAAILVFSLLICPLYGQEGERSDPKTNLDIMRLLSERIAATVERSTTGSDSIQIMVLPRERAWYTEEAVTKGLRSRGFLPTASPSARYGAEFGQNTLRVSYDDVRRDGFLGPKIIRRTIQVVLSVKIVDRATGEVITLKDVPEEARDTIALSEVERVENPNIPVTHGVLPAEGFFTSIAEPLVVLGSIAVAVYLLFHVRS